jgi:hypothetical protein
MVERLKIKEKELKSVYDTLKDKGYSLRDINSEINSDFRNHVYKGTSLDQDTFNKLEELYGEPIKHTRIQYTNGKKSPDTINITKCSRTAELIGIILGDGHLSKKINNCLCITLHNEEQELISHTTQLCKNVIDKEPRKYNLKGSKAVQLKINSKEVVEELLELGLKTGNKVDNQVNTPHWVKDEEKYQKACLRGLIDTDGSIYTQSTDKRTIIQFKNRSQPLLRDFKEMCKNLGIEPSNAGKFSVQVAAQIEVSRFIEKIDPIKAQGLKLQKPSSIS